MRDDGAFLAFAPKSSIEIIARKVRPTHCIATRIAASPSSSCRPLQKSEVNTASSSTLPSLSSQAKPLADSQEAGPAKSPR